MNFIGFAILVEDQGFQCFRYPLMNIPDFFKSYSVHNIATDPLTCPRSNVFPEVQCATVHAANLHATGEYAPSDMLRCDTEPENQGPEHVFCSKILYEIR